MNFFLLKEKVDSLLELKEGTSNLTYLINNRLVYRKKLNSDAPFYDATNEANVLKAIEGADISPTQLAFDLETGDKVEEYIASPSYFSSSEEDLRIYAKLLKRLHSRDAKGIKPFNAKKRYLYYKEKSGLNLGDDGLLKEVEPLFEGELVLAHNDLWKGNLLIKNGVGYLLDFEFAGLNVALFDLASIISENQIDDKEKILFFLREYYEKEDVNKEFESLKIMAKFEDSLWYYWAKCRYIDTKNENFLRIMADKKEAYLKAAKE